jgi:anti-sigma-K factor RskA
MAMTEIHNERSFADAVLPWYATGRLSPADTARVEQALRADPELDRRLELVQDELAETIRVNERLGAPSPHVIEKLFAKIDAEPRRRAATAGGLTARLSEWLSGLAPRTLAMAAVAGALVLLAQAGIIGSLLITDQPASFTTASYTKFEQPDGAFVLVGFAETATAAKVLEFLKTHNAVIVDGPRAGGLFKLRVSPEKLPREEVDKIAQRLRTDTQLVKLVAPTQ